jgi:hypothetical protein
MITGHFVFNPNASSKKLLKKTLNTIGGQQPRPTVKICIKNFLVGF